MNTFGLAVVLSFFITGIFAQTEKVSFSDKIFLKGGYTHSYRSATGYVNKDLSHMRGTAVYPRGWVDVFTGSIGYKLNNRMNVEMMYEYVGELSYSEDVFWKSTIEKKYYRRVYNSFKAHDVTLKGTLFVNDDRKVDPIYFVAGLTFSLQPVNNRFEDEDETETVITTQSYTRYLTGPMAGFGVFWETDFISFTTEMTIGTIVSFNRKELSETTFNLSISPIIGY